MHAPCVLSGSAHTKASLTVKIGPGVRYIYTRAHHMKTFLLLDQANRKQFVSELLVY